MAWPTPLTAVASAVASAHVRIECPPPVDAYTERDPYTQEMIDILDVHGLHRGFTAELPTDDLIMLMHLVVPPKPAVAADDDRYTGLTWWLASIFNAIVAAFEWIWERLDRWVRYALGPVPGLSLRSIAQTLECACLVFLALWFVGWMLHL